MPELKTNLIFSEDGNVLEVVRLFAGLPQDTVARIRLDGDAKELRRGLAELKHAVERVDEERRRGTLGPWPLGDPKGIRSSLIG